jgi:hypothetical protein
MEGLMEKICNDYSRDEKEQEKMGKPQAARFNEGKVRMDLIPPVSLEEIAKVYTYGTKKYSDDNWWKAFKWRKDTYGCIARHLNKWMRGEKCDDESGLHHLAHAAWNCIALMEFERNNLGHDDRIPYSLDLMDPEEQALKIKAWRDLADKGIEDQYNGLDFKLTKEDVVIK